jgi:hypothetical protein
VRNRDRRCPHGDSDSELDRDWNRDRHRHQHAEFARRQPRGTCDSNGGSGNGDQVPAVPVATAAQLNDGLSTPLMVIAAILFVGLCLGPPLVAQGIAYRRARRTSRDPFDQFGGRS